MFGGLPCGLMMVVVMFCVAYVHIIVVMLIANVVVVVVSLVEILVVLIVYQGAADFCLRERVDVVVFGCVLLCCCYGCYDC